MHTKEFCDYEKSHEGYKCFVYTDTKFFILTNEFMNTDLSESFLL